MLLELFLGSFRSREMKLKSVHVSCWGNSSGKGVCQRTTACAAFQHCIVSSKSNTLHTYSAMQAYVIHIFGDHGLPMHGEKRSVEQIAGCV